MKNNIKHLSLIITCLFVFSISVSAANTEVRVTNVVDAGTDGDERFYTVYCSNGKSAALVKRYTIGEVCTRPSYADKDICRDWSVDEAALESCK